MKSTAVQIEREVDQMLPKLLLIPEIELAHKSSPIRWSKKEIIGHMIDSAQNNIRRFIVAQYEINPHIVYKQDEWVRMSNYHQNNAGEMIQLWGLLNKQICHILLNMDEKTASRQCQSEDIHTLDWFAKDYLRHLRHHLHQVLDLEPVVYP